MIELTLVRHAKSDWNDESLADHDRPLNSRGLRDAPAMAQRFADSGARVQRIVSSNALRALTTAAAFGLALNVGVELDKDLYLASASRLLAVAADSGVDSVMLVAHNPGITDLAALLSRGAIDRMPTCAVARFAWDLDSWEAAAVRPANSWRLDTPHE